MMQNKMTAPPLQGISNLMKMQGRMGDTELVHMSPMEVKGLSSLGRLTRNPDTGLPEAFSIGGFFRDIVAPTALAAIPVVGPYASAGYQMAKTGAMGGSFIDAATAGLMSFAGGKLGGKIAEGLTTATGAAADAGSGAAADALTTMPDIGQQAFDSAVTQQIPLGDVTTTGAPSFMRAAADSAAGRVAQGSTAIADRIGSGLSSLSDMSLGDIASNLIPKTPKDIGEALGRTIGSASADAMLQDKLQSENIPKEVKDAETVQQEFSTGKLQNMNPQYADKDLSASRIVGAMQGTQAPLQFTDPSYSPAVTGNLSSILGAKNGGAMSNLKERAMGSQSKGLADALESITEGAEDIVDMGGGQVYFEGMVKGDGDGMSDEIPFSIEGQQPALLSRDEYVLPADVVSALGNGSSNAGADMLDKFMTDVREKTMGRERQINQIG
jgi:hypothetical protein